MSLSILHVIQSVSPTVGGPIEGIRQRAIYHDYLGDSIHIASLDTPGSTYLSFPAVTVVPLKCKWYDNLVPLSLYFWIRSNCRHYDAVIVNGIWGLHLLFAYLSIRRTKIPFFVFPHGMLDPWFRYQYPFRHLKKLLVWPWAVYIPLKSADGVCFTCEQERILARDSFSMYTCKELVVNYGTLGIPNPSKDYSSEFIRAHPEIALKKRLLFLGRLTPKKGLDILLLAISELRSRGLWNPEEMVLIVAGPSEGGYLDKLKRLSASIGIPNSVKWTGMLRGDSKWGAFQSSRSFILPSHQENFGIAVAEALSCSIPVLLTHKVNIAPEIVASGAGFAEPDNRAGIVRLLESWLALDDRTYSRMAANARFCFQQRYEISKAALSLNDAIRSCASVCDS